MTQKCIHCFEESLAKKQFVAEKKIKVLPNNKQKKRNPTLNFNFKTQGLDIRDKMFDVER